jgi:hypothetical protein
MFELIDAFETLYLLITHECECDHRNGVTDSSGTMDEGHVRAGNIIETARTLLRRYGRDVD